LRGPDLFRIVLDPAGVRIDLFKLSLGQAADCTLVVEEYGSGTGCSLI
jgi:hypothetical protein